jgi:hypothetical protein
MSAQTFGQQFDSIRNEFAPRLSSENESPNEMADTEYLGVFTASPVNGSVKMAIGAGPKIFLCPERIERCAKNSANKNRARLIKVFLHEWMHAAMHIDPDPLRCLSNRDHRYIVYAGEEATANFGALQAMDSLNCQTGERHPKWGSLVDDALEFVKSQPAEYALGGKMFMDKAEHFDPLQWLAFKKEEATNLGLGVHIWANQMKQANLKFLEYSMLMKMWKDLIE